ncbi:MAG: bacillithiol biosynthesis deacetylase BshB1 [Acidobacteria bacterium RIFCSPLOWO2_12_FULL_54_10]|nr:MAG: bacillithiol biosynthesis deacetylase BshB1 [Acidobacteria bacterium RIFCSPLOWO2_12_FULL_54_10]
MRQRDKTRAGAEIKQPLDVMAFGAHPDDVELLVGGTLAKLAKQGYRTGAVDLTRGELGTRGTEEIRAKESAAASEILKLSVRENLGIPDGHIEKSQDHILRVIRVLRQYRPRLIMIPHWEERHCDHVHTSELVAEAAFYAGLKKIETGQESFRPFRVLYYVGRMGFRPSFIVDVSETFDTKMKAVRAHQSQFHRGQEEAKAGEAQTFISSVYALEVFETMAKYYGAMIGAKYGEPYLMREAVELADPVAFFREFPDGRLPHLFPTP